MLLPPTPEGNCLTIIDILGEKDLVSLMPLILINLRRSLFDRDLQLNLYIDQLSTGVDNALNQKACA